MLQSGHCSVCFLEPSGECASHYSIGGCPVSHMGIWADERLFNQPFNYF